ncbi:hypothetical protein [Clostridium aciditolerans]|uniref:hypothetical protein n=1 Tax=Clostridium aciditolerans TaxID=339861 RepID=UPI001B3C5FD8|nr:hypothetical protein [Clostridium aciditolerans]
MKGRRIFTSAFLLLNYLIQVAKEQTFNKLVLSTFESNDIDKKFYKTNKCIFLL